jgi:hypothetical protein
MDLNQLKDMYEAGWMPIISVMEDRVVGISSGIPGFAPARAWVSAAGMGGIQYVIFSHPLVACGFSELPEDEVKALPEMCDKCGVNPAQEHHSCPYNEELYDDYETTCNCCEECALHCWHET